MLHLFVVLNVSSLIKKGISSTRGVIAVWKLAPASRKSSSKYWRFVLEFIYQSFYGSILRESVKATMSIIHGCQAHAIQTIRSNLKDFRATIQIQVDSEDKQIKQNAV